MKKILCLTVMLFGFVVSHAESTGEIMTFPADPAKGFHWGYALYLPQTMDTSKKLPVLLIMTDTGVTDTPAEMEKITLWRLKNERSEYPVADELGIPLVMPMVWRPKDFYTQDLSRAVLVSQEEQFKRLDLQVLAMLQDARKQLKKRRIKTKNKFLVTGFSSAGVFAWRWTMLHPEYVLATATGGALYHMLPIEEWETETLIYPVGVGDMKLLTGKKFNKKAWSKIPIFSTNGEKDNNDTFGYEECFAEKVERPVLQKVLPGKDIFERRAQSLQLLARLAPNVQTHLYPWLGHKPVTKDVIAFLKMHLNGGPLQTFTPTDTSDQKPELIEVVRVAWGTEPNLPDEVKKTWGEEKNIILQTRATSPTWVYRTYGQIELVDEKGETVVQPRNQGSMSDGKQSFLSFRLSYQDWKRLQGKKLWIRAVYPDMLQIPADPKLAIQ